MSACMIFAGFASLSSGVFGRHGRLKLYTFHTVELTALEGLTPAAHLECAIDLTIGLLEGAVEGGEEQAWECEKELLLSKVLGVGFDKTPGDSENLNDFRECTFGYEVNGSRHDLGKLGLAEEGIAVLVSAFVV